MVTFDQTQELANLIWLRLTVHVLEVHQFWYARVDEYVMASFHTSELKAKSFKQLHSVFERDILQSALGKFAK